LFLFIGLPIIREMKIPCLLLLVCLFFVPGFAYSQEADRPLVSPDNGNDATGPVETPEFPADSETPAASRDGAEGGSAPPRSFRGIFLGIGLEQLKEAIRGDRIFNFREDRDVSFLPSDQEQTLVETQGFGFIRRAFFQLRQGEVFIMSFTLDTSLVDHYSVFTAFVNRYGEPASLNPREAVWETDTTRVSIERPLTVKYIDKHTFDRLKLSPEEIPAGPSANGARELLNRNEFLEGF
jgi:hypothetical protein